LTQKQEAKGALEKREEAINPGKEIDGKKQISFADEEARIMGKKGSFDHQYNGRICVDEDNKIIAAQHLILNTNDKNAVNLLEKYERNNRHSTIKAECR
jgi:hypothetical protein